MADGSGVARKAGNAAGAKGPCCSCSSAYTGGRDAMTRASIGLQDLQRRIYDKAKAEPSWRFWGLVRPCGQAGDAPHGVRSGKGQQWGAGHRRRHVRGHRSERRRGVSPTAPGRTGLPHGLGPCGAGSRRSRRPMAARSESSRSPRSATAWSRARSSASWSPSLRLTFNRGRLGTARRSRRIKRWTG